MKLKVICDYCKVEYEMPYSQYRKTLQKHNKIACQKCSGIKVAEITLAQRREEIYNRLKTFCDKNNYKLITKQGEIMNVQSDVHYVCPIHGDVTTKIANALQGKHCYKCSRKTALEHKSQTTMKSRQTSLFDRAKMVASKNNYEISSDISEIKNNTTEIKYVCPIHGEHKMRISNFISGRRCPECFRESLSQKYRLNKKEVISRVKSCGGKLLNPDDYINNNLKNLKFVCSECGNIFISSLSNFTLHNGQVCPECSHKESNGERKVRKFLERNNICFIQEKKFEDCKDVRSLPFDFYLPDYNAVIEFDGEQHFIDKGNFSNPLEYTQRHDEIKNNYCLENNIDIIRIPYWKMNEVELYLSDKLNILNLHKDIV